jgi:nucleoside-diphosphate-sugar epimerase
MADVLILGGTRNLGHFAAIEALRGGHNVTVLNRGVTPNELPTSVERLRADRTDPSTVAKALASRTFDLVLDTTTYTGSDAEDAVDQFDGRVGRYVFVSSGQVYLVRVGAEPPFTEDMYDGRVMDDPDEPVEHTEWKYGVDKRDAEAVFKQAWSEQRFPVTTLRLPMVASERDHYGRIQGYLARLYDGEPILVTESNRRQLRHVYAGDVARLVCGLVTSPVGIGRAYNISYGNSLELHEFLELLARFANRELKLHMETADAVTRSGLLPDCSPFREKWMSVLDNSRSLVELRGAGIAYTPPEDYLPLLIDDYENRWRRRGIVPRGYAQRPAELAYMTNPEVKQRDA